MKHLDRWYGQAILIVVVCVIVSFGVGQYALYDMNKPAARQAYQAPAPPPAPPRPSLLNGAAIEGHFDSMTGEFKARLVPGQGR